MMDEMAVSPHFLSRHTNSYLEYSEASHQMSQRNDLPSQSSLTAVHHADVRSFDVEADMAEALMPPAPNVRPKNIRSALEEWVFVFTIMMCTASTTFLQGATVINTGTIGNALNMTAAEITWISASLGLSSGSFVLFFGKTADLFGRKVQLLAGLAFLSLFALLTSFAPNGIALNVLLGFLGLGTAAIAPPAVGILLTTYPPGRRRNTVMGALGCCNPIGFVIGSISAGVATKYSTWRASFIIVAIFFFAMTAVAFWTVPTIPRAGSLRVTVRQFDYLGTVLTVMGMAIFSAALTEAPVAGWKSPKVIIMVVLGLLSLAGFALWENVYTHPLLDPSVWENRNFNLCILCVLFGYMSFITNQFWISLYMQDVQMMSPLHIAARLLPQTVTGIIWSYLGQWMVSRYSGTAIMGAGALAYVLGATLLIFIRQNSRYWFFLFPSLCITVMGADFQFIVSNLYINTQMPDQSSLGVGVLQTAQRLSISLGLAITAAVYGTTSQSEKGKYDVNLPFDRAFLCTILFAVVGCLFVPFMSIGKQGGDPETEKNELLEERPRTGGEYSDRSSEEHGHNHSHQDDQYGLEFGSSTLTVDTMATTGSQKSYFPRWSWEDGRQWKDRRFRESNIVYEVCIKCLEERRVIVRENEVNTPGWQQVPDEGRHLRSEVEDVENGWNQLPDESRQARREVEDVESGWTQLPDERRQSKHRSERAWQRFPVVPTRRVERGDVSSGGNGWL